MSSSSMKSPLRPDEIRQLLGSIPPENVYTNLQKTKKGVLIYASNTGGCSKENSQGDDLSNVPCKNSTYQAYGRFLRKNKNNRIIFQGNIFGDGSYTMTDIHNILMLLFEFNYTNGQPNNIEGENQVTIVLGPKDVNVLRLKYELHKLLQQLKVEHPEIGIEMKDVIKYKDKKSRKQGKAYGNYIPYNYMITDDFHKIYSHVFVSSVYERVKAILKTCGCYMPYCLLFDKNFNEFYILSKNEQNIELMLLVEKLSVFTLLYAFVPEVKYDPFLSTTEVKHVVTYLLGEIRKIIEELRSYRSDIYVRQMWEILHRMEFLIADPKKTHNYIEELMPLETWRTNLLHFYNNARLVHYDEDFHTIATQFDPTYSLPAFINCFLPFSDYVKRDPDKLFKQKAKPGEEWSIEHYYQRWSDMYEKFLSLNIIQKLCHPTNNPYVDYLNNKKKKPKTSKKEPEPESDKEGTSVEENNNSLNNSDGEGNQNGGYKFTRKKYRKARNNTKLSNKKNKNKKKKEEKKSMKGGSSKTDNIEDELSINSFFDSISFNETIVQMHRLYKFDPAQSNYKNLYITQVFRYINRHYRAILQYPSILQSDSYLNQFIFLQVFYTFLRHNKGRVSPLNGKHVRKNKELWELFKLKKIYHIYCSNIDLKLPFSLPIINIYGVNFIFLDRMFRVKKKFDYPRKGKFLHDSYEDMKYKELLKLYNYPVLATNTIGELEQLSITISGGLKKKKTYLGPLFFHTFRNFFMLHEEIRDIRMLEFKADYGINMEGDYNKLEAYMLPILQLTNTTTLPRVCFVDNMYFIKIMPKVKSLNHIFLILDLEKSLTGGKYGYYLGSLNQWMGFFWDRKKMYQRKIKNIPLYREKLQVFINYYLQEMDTMRMYLPFTEEVIDIEFKDEPPLLDKEYTFNTIYSKDDFLSKKEISKMIDEPDIVKEDYHLSSIKEHFDKLFSKKNVFKPGYTLSFNKLEPKEEFNFDVTKKSVKKNKEISITVNNVKSAISEKSISKGYFKELFAYDKKTMSEDKYRYMVNKLDMDKFNETEYHRELSILIRLAVPESDSNYVPFQNKLVSFLGLNFNPEEDNYYYLTDKTDFPNLNLILSRDSGKINGNNYLFDLENKSINNTNFLDLLLDVCEGMEYLSHIGINHLDLFSKNIIPFNQGSDGKIVFKISEFGDSKVDRSNLLINYKAKKPKTLSKIKKRVLDEGENNIEIGDNAKNSIGFLEIKDNKPVLVNINDNIKKHTYACPLLGVENGIYSEKTDVWSFGFLFMEILANAVKLITNVKSPLLLVNPNDSKTNKANINKKSLIDSVNILSGEKMEDYQNICYHLLLNKDETLAPMVYPKVEYSNKVLYCKSDFSDFVEDKPTKSDYLKISGFQENIITDTLKLDPKTSIDINLSQFGISIAKQCYTSYVNRKSFKEINEYLQSNSSYFMGDKFIEKENQIDLELIINKEKDDKNENNEVEENEKEQKENGEKKVKDLKEAKNKEKNSKADAPAVNINETTKAPQVVNRNTEAESVANTGEGETVAVANAGEETAAENAGETAAENAGETAAVENTGEGETVAVANAGEETAAENAGETAAENAGETVVENQEVAAQSPYVDAVPAEALKNTYKEGNTTTTNLAAIPTSNVPIEPELAYPKVTLSDKN